MAEHKVGDVRPTQLLHTYGVGAMVDLPNIAAMVMGLDDWKLTHATPIGEERLLAAVKGQLGGQVEKLRLPPVDPDEGGSDPMSAARIGVPVAAFPQWYRCPWCDLVAPLSAGLFFTASGVSPWAICHTISPLFRSIALMRPHGGLINGNPCTETPPPPPSSSVAPPLM